MSSFKDVAVIICHGSYHSTAPYMPLIDALKLTGIDAYCPQLPTADLSKLNVGNVKNPDFDGGPPPEGYPQGGEDTEVVTGVLKHLIQDLKKKVLLVAHSSGGWVATEAAKPEWHANSKQGSSGIIGILYVGAFVIPVGESVNTFFQPKDGSFVTPPFMEFHKFGGAGLALAQKWAASLTESPILTSKLTNNAYASLPCGYLVLEGDLTLPKEYQEGMIAQQSQITGDFTVYRTSAGHSPHLSWTDGMVNTIYQFLAKVSM